MHNHLQKYRIFFCFFFILPLNRVAAVQGADPSGAFKTPISLSGTIEPAGSLKVQSSVGGRVAIIHVEENQNVNKGQLLLTLKNDAQKRQLELSHLQLKINKNNVKDRQRLLELAKVQLQINENNVKDRKELLELAKLQIEVSTNNVKDLETNLEDIQRRLEDENTLYEQGSSTRSQLDALQLQYKRGVLAVKNVKLGLKRSRQEINRSQLGIDNTILILERSKEDVQRARLGVENSSLAVERSKQDLALKEEALNDTHLVAKIGGIVNGKFIEEGEVINPGTVLFQIVDIRQVEIEIQVAEEDLPRIKKGQLVVFATPSYRDKQFPGVIERISWSADPETGRFPLYVKAVNPGLKLRAGMSAKVYLLWKK